MIVSGDCLEATDIRPMSDLSLRIATHNITVDSSLKIESFVFLCAHELDVGDEHNEMGKPWKLMWVSQK